MKNIKLSFVLVSLLGFFSCSLFDSKPKLVEQKLFEKIRTESNGNFVPYGFIKTNGSANNLLGLQLYEMEYSYTITVQNLCYKNGNPFTGYFQDFRTAAKLPTDAWDRREWANAIGYNVGDMIHLTGKAMLQKKDNGWQVESLDVVTATK